jgi:endonuclease YncB( thermonuclease family)
VTAIAWATAFLLVFLLCPGLAGAAEVLQVRGATLLQLGDQNRSYTVQLACIAVAESRQDEAVAWLRQAAPRHTRVNLRPMGQNDGVLLARVQTMASLQRTGGSVQTSGDDLGSGLISAGLAQSVVTESGECAKV